MLALTSLRISAATVAIVNFLVALLAPTPAKLTIPVAAVSSFKSRVKEWVVPSPLVAAVESIPVLPVIVAT